MSLNFDRVSKAFCVILLLFFFESPLTRVFPQTNLFTNRLTFFLYLVISFFVIFLLGFSAYKRRAYIIQVLRGNLFLLMLAGFAASSIIWAVDPKATLRFILGFGMATVFGLYLAFYYSIKEQLKIFACAYGIFLFVNAVMVFAFPDFGVDKYLHPGAWMGVTTHKNVLGGIASLGAIIFFFVLTFQQKFRLLFLVGFCISLWVLIFSISFSSFVIVMFIISVMLVFERLEGGYNFSRSRFLAAILIIVICSLAFLIMIFYFSPNRFLYGKIPSFSERVELWDYLFKNVIPARPILGYGLRGYFFSTGDGLGMDFVGYLKPNLRLMSNACNGFFQLLVDLGFVGLFLFIFDLAVKFRRSWKFACTKKGLVAFWPLSFFLFLILINLLESRFLTGIRPGYWLIYVAVSFSLYLAPKDD